MNIPETVIWHSKDEKPMYDGRYVVTVLTALMVDIRTGPHSFAREIDTALYTEYDGWSHNILAWTDIMPYTERDGK